MYCNHAGYDMNWHETISKYTYQNHSKSIKIINHFLARMTSEIVPWRSARCLALFDPQHHQFGSMPLTRGEQFTWDWSVLLRFRIERTNGKLERLHARVYVEGLPWSGDPCDFYPVLVCHASCSPRFSQTFAWFCCCPSFMTASNCKHAVFLQQASTLLW